MNFCKSTSKFLWISRIQIDTWNNPIVGEELACKCKHTSNTPSTTIGGYFLSNSNVQSFLHKEHKLLEGKTLMN